MRSVTTPAQVLDRQQGPPEVQIQILHVRILHQAQQKTQVQLQLLVGDCSPNAGRSASCVISSVPS